MDIILDKSRLEKLLNSFFVVTGLKFGIFDNNFQELFSTSDQSAFCTLIKDTQFGRAKCLDCDARSFKVARQRKDMYIYRCHAGLMEACSPIIENEGVIAYLMYGQILDDTPYEEQWEQAEHQCGWHHDLARLKAYFFELDHISSEKLAACAEIMSACTAYIWLKRVVQSYQQTDAQRLVAYIQQNFEKSIALDTIAGDLNMSKTKLCTMAKSQLHCTVGQLIASARIDAAKKLLQSTDLPISEISIRVGIGDYNYFSRLFKAQQNITPTQFRSLVRTD